MESVHTQPCFIFMYVEWISVRYFDRLTECCLAIFCSIVKVLMKHAVEREKD